MENINSSLNSFLLNHSGQFMVLCNFKSEVIFANQPAQLLFNTTKGEKFSNFHTENPSNSIIEIKDSKIKHLSLRLYKHNEDGIEYYLHTFDDITKEFEKIRELEDSEHTLRELIDLVPHAIFLKDSERRFLIVNKAVSKHHNLTKEDMLGKRDEDFFNIKDASYFIQNEIEILKTKQPLFIPEESFTTKEGIYKVMETIKVPFYIPNIKEWGILGVAIDITKRNELKEEQTKMQLQYQNSLMKAVVTTQERERSIIAHDLHDGLGQLLTAAKMNLNAFTSSQNKEMSNFLITSEQLMEQSIQEVRTITHNLVPGVLNDFGLITALERLLEGYRTQTNTTLTLRTHAVDEDKIKPIGKNLYRICQEALNNAMKYAEAKQVSIQLFRRNNTLILQIEDDGIGFDIDKVMNKNEGLGLKSIINRVNLMDGEMDISTSEGRGCEYSIIIDLDKINYEQD